MFEYLDRISTMNKLMKNGKTGSPNEFAVMLGVSRSSLYEMIDELRSRGAPISYSKSLRTFRYEEPFDIYIECTLKPLSHEDQRNLSGGLYMGKLFSMVMAEPEGNPGSNLDW